MDAGGWQLIDRRRAARHRRVDGLSVRIRPGHEAEVVDLSSTGALVIVTRPLRPGLFVVLQFVGLSTRTLVRARILRSWVSAITADAVRYHAAVGFDRHVDWLGSIGSADTLHTSGRT